MKKNITINLCGRLFQIDEDAYELLQHYFESLRHSCFPQDFVLKKSSICK